MEERVKYAIIVRDNINYNRKFYNSYTHGEFRFTSDINKAELYIKRGWANKCMKKVLDYYNANLFKEVSAEVISLH